MSLVGLQLPQNWTRRLGQTLLIVAAGILLGFCFTHKLLSVLAFGLIVFAAGIAWFVRNPTAASICFLASVILMPHSLFLRFGGIAITFDRVVMAPVLIAFVILFIRNDINRKNFYTPLNASFFAFFGIGVFSLLVNLPSMNEMSAQLGYKTLANQLGNLALPFMILWTISLATGKQDKLIKATIYLVSISALVGIFEYLTDRYLIVEAIERLPVGIETQEYLAYLEKNRLREGIKQVTSTFDYSLEFGSVLVFMIPISLVMAKRCKSAERILLWLSLGTMFLATMLTVSRTPILALFIEVIVVMMLSRQVSGILFAISSFGFLGAVTALALPHVMDSILKRFFPAGGMATDPNIQSRLRSYDFVSQLWYHNPFFGVGPGSLLRGSYLKQHTDQPVVIDFVDNYYLMTLGELGAIGLIVLLVFLIKTWFSMQNQLEVDREYLAALCAGLAGFLAVNLSFDALGQMGCTTVVMVLLVCGLTAGSNPNEVLR